MAVIGSLPLSPSLGICRGQEQRKEFTYVTGRRSYHLLPTTLSSRASRQDSWSLQLSSSIDRPLCRLPYRCNVLRCNSFLFNGQNVAIPSIKTATVALTKSCNSLQSSPFITKFVSAIGIIIFALWGLGPLMRISRKIFLRKSDSSWKRSTTNYVVTSYLQPVLLWTSAILLCRAVDPIVMPTEAGQLVKLRVLNFVKSISTVLAFAYCLSSVIQQVQKYLLETNDPSDAHNMGFQFAGKAIYSAVWVAAVALFMELLGFSTQKWLTAGGLGTVLLTLAGREIFTNFLSSAMIHATRPFLVNEWIQTKIGGYDVSGTVEHVGWWSPTIIRGEDREAVHIPNHKFTVNVVRNLSQKTHWRIKTHLAISHLDVGKIHSIVADMRKVLAKNPHVEQQKLHRRVFLENVDPENQALLILISCFVKTSRHEEYLCVKEAILLDLLRVISHHRARLATPIRTIQKFYNEPDLDSMLFSSSFYSRGGPTAKRPMLLIEPSYKINGEEKSKSQARNDQKNVKETSKQGKKVEGKDESKASIEKTDDKATLSSTTRSNRDTDGSKKSEKSQQNLNVEVHGTNDKTSTGSESSKSTSTTVEENLVLGVALEGSKRTLPIEEIDSPSILTESKVPARSNGHGKPVVDKDEKDN